MTASWYASQMSGQSGSSPPNLTVPVATPTGATTATVSVTTNKISGKIYWFVSTSATPPSATNLKNGTGAAAFGNVVVHGNGVKTADVAGLSTATTYYCYFLHHRGIGTDSNIAVTLAFTTS